MRDRLGFMAALAAGLLMLAPGGVQAGPRDHDGGFFLRMSTGFGADHTKSVWWNPADPQTATISISSDEILLGRMFGSNFALHASISEWSRGHDKLAILGIGGGLTYYFMPANVYVTANAEAGSDESSRNATGLVLNLSVGKEWWASDRWGLGVALTAGSHDVSNPPTSHEGWIAAVRFSATLN